MRGNGTGLSCYLATFGKQVDNILGVMVLEMQDPSVRIQDSGPQSVMIVSDYCLSQRRKQARMETEGYHCDVLHTVKCAPSLEGRQ